jgi:hypothetical protein
MQLLLYKTGKLVRAEYFGAYMGRAFYLSKAVTASAEASKWLGHVPLGRWIKEGHFITLCYWLQGHNLHGMRVKKYIGIAAMIYVLQVFGV